MAACPQAFANPASLLHGHPVSAVGRQAPHHYLSSLHTSGPGVCLPGETRGKGAQANAAGMRTWEDSLDSCTPLPFLPFLGEKRHVEMEASRKTNQEALQT